MARYLTLAMEAVAEIEILKSRFIARGKSVRQVSDAEAFLKSIQIAFPDATHHCYAFKVQGPPVVDRYSDAGEPNGTAGKPIYTVLSHHITNAIIVVTRYYGGTKLGKGGLVKAYTEAAKALLEKAGTLTAENHYRFRLTYPYALSDEMAKLITQFDETPQFEYDIQITATVSVGESDLGWFEHQMAGYDSFGLLLEALDCEELGRG